MSQLALKTKNVAIYADTREQGSVVLEILKKLCEVRIKQLKIGDYILSDELAVERKTAPDFVKSIIDRRLFEQLRDLKENFKKPILLVEGDPTLFTNVHENALFGAIASVIESDVNVVFTRTPRESALIMYHLARRAQQELNKSLAIREKRKMKTLKEQQEFLVAGLPNINKKLAEELLKHFKTPEKVFSATEAQLMHVKGIGKEKAKKIKEILTTRYA